MFSNIGGLEVLFVAMVALIVLGPTKLPEAARQAGKFVQEIRRMSSGFQKEFREAVQDPIVEAEARARGNLDNARNAVTAPFQEMKAPIEPTKKPAADTNGSSTTGSTGNSGGSSSAAPESADD